MSDFWSLWVISLTLLTLLGSLWVLFANRKSRFVSSKQGNEQNKTGHVYDGIEELDNPLPAWWFWLFLITVLFAAVYLLMYPGLGKFPGLLQWTQEAQWQERVAEADSRLDEQFAEYASTAIADLAADPGALRMGRRLFNNNCAVCHAVGGTGANGFPDLTDGDWLYGGSPDDIQASIANGRSGVMPAWGTVIGDDGVNNVSEYVLKLAGAAHDEEMARQGANVFSQFCTSCHGADGKGNTVLGAPDLTDTTWLYRQQGQSPGESIRHSVRDGRKGVMPAHSDKLRAEKIHLLSAYVYSLSHTSY